MPTARKEMVMKISAVIVAGGKGKRMGAGINKVLLPLCGKAIIARTAEEFENNARVDEIIIVTGEEDIEAVKAVVGACGKVAAVIGGGAERQQSVFNGLLEASGDIVLIHDGARALITDIEIENAINDCIKYGAAAVGVPCKDTLKSADADGFIKGTVDRDRTYMIQTPQAFETNMIRMLHKRAASDGLTVTDDCAIAEYYGVKVKITEGSYGNIKLTTPVDLAVGEMILKKRSENDEDRTGL